MKHYLARKLISDPDETGSPIKSIAINTLKLLGILAATIVVTQLMFGAGVAANALLMIYFLAVLVISFTTPKYFYGGLAAVLASFAFDFFLIDPHLGFSFTIGYPITLFTMLLVTFLTSTLTIQLRNQAILAQKKEQRAELLSEISRALMRARDEASIIKTGNRYLASCLDRPAIFYSNDPKSCPLDLCVPVQDGVSDAFFSPEEQKRVHRIFQSGAADVLEEDEEGIFYQPVTFRGTVLGVIGIDTGGKPLGQGARSFLQILSRQLGPALKIQRMSQSQSELKIGAEKEKMRSTFLRSISHDLRTPLTSILGAGTAILEQKDMPEKMRDSLLTDIQENAKWLIRMVENILTVTRISKETMQLHKTVEAAEEVVSQAVSIVRGRFPDCHIHIKIPDELVMVPMDATLISQVIINLLENAVKNSPEGGLVLLTLKKQGELARFEVSDHGSGLPEYLLDNLFEIHTQAEDVAVDASRGIGIGLSICQTIIQAHGGTIEGHNREEGGAKFTFLLPLGEKPAPEHAEEDEEDMMLEEDDA